MSDDTPRYLDLVLRHVQENPPTPGQVTFAEVAHDSWCAFWRDGVCNCNPSVETGARVNRKYRRALKRRRGRQP